MFYHFLNYGYLKSNLNSSFTEKPKTRKKVFKIQKTHPYFDWFSNSEVFKRTEAKFL